MIGRTNIKDLHEKVGQEAVLAGWVKVRRDHGKLIFIDLRDATGVVQMVALPAHEEAHKIADTLRSEWVIKVTGLVRGGGLLCRTPRFCCIRLWAELKDRRLRLRSRLWKS